MQDLFSQFVRDRRYLKGVSTRTEVWYWQSWNAYASVLKDRKPDELSKADFLNRIEAMRRQGVSAITINTYSRAVNALLRWLHEEGHSTALVAIPRLKEEQKIIPTLTADQTRRLLEYRPKGLNNTSAWTVAMPAMDTGIRLNEALSLRRDDLDFDNLLIAVRDGKGGKQRVVPIERAGTSSTSSESSGTARWRPRHARLCQDTDQATTHGLDRLSEDSLASF
jgi:integrase/recombinase XerD